MAQPPPPGLDLSTSTPLANQVAGHQNVRSDASGSLVIKPSLPKEIAFYQMVQSAPKSSRLARIEPFLPKFYGTLRLEGQLNAEGTLATDLKGSIPESVVLENMSHAYTHPCILDAKLGTVLHTPDAAPEKKAKMQRDAEGTTTAKLGMRLTGCQTWHEPSQSFILTPKSYGKSIKDDELPTGFRRYIPAPNDVIPGLVVLPPTPPPTATPAPAPGLLESDGSYRNHAIPPANLLRVLDIIDTELAKLEELLSTLEVRFVGSSVLVVYEGDPARLADALDRYEAKQARRRLIAAEQGVAEPSYEEKETENDSDTDSDSDSESDSDDLDGVKEDAREQRRCPPVSVRMIDFAHTWIVEGEGPDQGVLRGLKTLRGLVQGRKVEIGEGVRGAAP